MKKLNLFYLLLILVGVFSLSACGGDDDTTTKGITDIAPEQKSDGVSSVIGVKDKVMDVMDKQRDKQSKRVIMKKIMAQTQPTSMCDYLNQSGMDLTFPEIPPIYGEVSGTMSFGGFSSSAACANEVLALTLGMTMTMTEFNDGDIPGVGNVTMDGDMSMDLTMDMPLTMDLTSDSDEATANISGNMTLSGAVEGTMEFNMTDNASCSTNYPNQTADGTGDDNTWSTSCTGTVTGTINGESMDQTYTREDSCTQTIDTTTFSGSVTCNTTESITENGETKTNTYSDTFTF